MNELASVPGEARRELALYEMPCFLVWAIEDLARSTRKGKDAAFAGAINLGLERVERFPDVAVILAARLQALRLGDPEAMHWFDHCKPIDVDSGGAGLHEERFRRRIPLFLAKHVGTLANELGLNISHLAILTLTAAFLGTRYVVGPYQDAMFMTLTRLRDRLRQRALRAPAYVRSAATNGPETAYAFDDLLCPDSEEDADAERDDETDDENDGGDF